MRYWYLGSPYSKFPGGLHMAHGAVCYNAGLLITAGVPVYSPIAHTHSIALCAGMDPYDHTIWLPADLPLMQAAKGIIVLKLASWQESKGLAYEIETFEAWGRPVVFMDPGIVPDLEGK